VLWNHESQFTIQWKATSKPRRATRKELLLTPDTCSALRTAYCALLVVKMGLSCCKSSMAGGSNWNRKGYKQANNVGYLLRMRTERSDWNEDDAMVVYITILGCDNLKAMKNFTGFSGPYVESSLSPPDPVAGLQKQRTSFQPNTASPKWVIHLHNHCVVELSSSVSFQSPGERLQFLLTSKNEHMKIKMNTYDLKQIPSCLFNDYMYPDTASTWQWHPMRSVTLSSILKIFTLEILKSVPLPSPIRLLEITSGRFDQQHQPCVRN
jgi:hypothetical protein